MKNDHVKAILNLRVQRAIRGKRLTEDQLAAIIANEFINLVTPLNQVA